MDIEYKQKFTEIIFNNIHDGIIMLDKNYKILTINKSVEKWIEKPTHELIDKDCREVFHGNSWVCPHCAAEVVFNTGQVNILTQKVNLNDTTYYAELSAYPVQDESGEVIECVVFIQDITDRMVCHDEILRLYNEVNQTKEYLEGIIENSADAIVTSDLDGLIISWNKGAEKIYGLGKYPQGKER